MCLPTSWVDMKQILTHSENIKNFSDVSQHVILDADTQDADKTLTYVAQGGSHNANGKRRRQNKKGKKNEASTSAPKEEKIKKRKREKHGGKKDFSKIKCFNCQQQRHFARDCTEPKRVRSESLSQLYVSSHVMVADSQSVWFVDTCARKYVAYDRVGFVGYHRIPVGSKHIFMGNNSSEEVLGVGSYQLKLRNRRTLLLKDVRYAPTVWLNLLSVTALLDIGFSFNFRGPRATKSIFLRYSEKFKGYVMYGEHPNGGKTEIESRDVNFIESDFSSFGDEAGNDMSSIVATKQWLPSTSEMKDMGEANYVLGVKIIRDRPKRFLGVTADADEAVTVHCDNTTTLDFVKDPKYHEKAKHIGLRYHFIRTLVVHREVTMKHIPTCRMVVDHLTKPITRDVFLPHIRSMGLRRV
ncbi:hypothetical protein RJ640_015724 [Escallonia rubra]|uniref:CCHC-type domain-containing protein n=1 Tax=Escallonia rubra TaxID=112253 RepID=A0AA88S0G0_9ASTE|nr:hypothetical protein RJ640_015724 [Escallonia rubra]